MATPWVLGGFGLTGHKKNFLHIFLYNKENSLINGLLHMHLEGIEPRPHPPEYRSG